MARYSSTVRDQYGKPISGAQVLVARSDGTPAELTDDAGLLLSNPIPTDQYGGYYFNADSGFYDLSYYFGGRLVQRDRGVPVGINLEDFLEEAEGFANAAIAMANVQPSIPAGIANTPDGGYFSVSNVDGSVSVYRRSGATAVLLVVIGESNASVTVQTKALAAARTYAADVGAVRVLGYTNPGDLGAALYRRKTANPAVAPTYSNRGWFQSADGAYWELAEPSLNPFMFGAAGDDNGAIGAGTDDSDAFNAMFRYLEAKLLPYPINLCGGRFNINQPVLLPRFNAGYQTIVTINGGGARLRSNANITIMGSLPTTQSQADQYINWNRFSIRGVHFFGNIVLANQTGLHISCSYMPEVALCNFENLGYGFVGTFCLNGKFDTLQSVNCITRPFMVQTGGGFDAGALWTGASYTNSASNVCTFSNCRVYGRSPAIASFSIFGSDDVKLQHCISEGNHAGYDVHFDYQGSTTVKRFMAEGMHCEAPLATVNFRIRAAGEATITDIVRSYPAQIFDCTGSGALALKIDGLSFTGNMPAGAWFTTAGGAASGHYYEFQRCFTATSIADISDPAKWGGTLPTNLYIAEYGSANGGFREYTRGRRSLEGMIAVQGVTAPPAGGDAGARVLFGAGNVFGIYYGSGVPTVNLGTGGKGSLYLRNDGTGPTDRIYVHTGSGWTPLTAGA